MEKDKVSEEERIINRPPVKVRKKMVCKPPMKEYILDRKCPPRGEKREPCSTYV